MWCRQRTRLGMLLLLLDNRFLNRYLCLFDWCCLHGPMICELTNWEWCEHLCIEIMYAESLISDENVFKVLFKYNRWSLNTNTQTPRTLLHTHHTHTGTSTESLFYCDKPRSHSSVVHHFKIFQPRPNGRGRWAVCASAFVRGVYTSILVQPDVWLFGRYVWLFCGYVLRIAATKCDC